jgi:DNA mismatch repair protein MutS
MHKSSQHPNTKLINLKELSFGNANLMKDYFDISNKYILEYGINTILLMQVGSFFEVYGLKDINDGNIKGSNIEDFSRICELNIVEKNVCSATLKGYTVVMAGFKDFIVEKYVKKLQDAGFTSVVYTQDEAAPNTPRSLHAIYSPGTFFSTESTNITNNTLCVWINVVDTFLNNKRIQHNNFKKIYIGVANINIYTGKSSIFEFSEIYINNPATFDELERFVSIYSPNEAIVIANLSICEIDNVISYANIQCSCIHKISLLNDDNIKAANCEKQIYQKQLLEKFYTIHDFSTFIQNFNNNIIATQAFCYLLDFIYQHNPNLINKISEPLFENCSDRLVLANHSLKQLNIIDDTTYSGKYSSVLKMLNCCITSMGKRSFSHNFLNPTTDTKYLQQEYDITEHLLKKSYPEIKNYLSTIKDISKINRQIMLKKIAPKSLFYLYQNLITIQQIYKAIDSDLVLLDYLKSKIKNFNNLLLYSSELTKFIETNMSINDIENLESYQNFEINFIQKGISSLLDTETQTLMESYDKLECCRNYFNQLVANYEKKTKATEYIKIHETEKNNFSLIATDRRSKILQSLLTDQEYIDLTYKSSYNNEVKTFNMSISKKLLEVYKQTASNNGITTPQINQLCKSITTIKSRMKDIINNVYNSIIVSLESYTDHFDCLIDFVTYIDIIFAKVHIATKYNYVKPIIVNEDKSFVEITELRHCLIEQIQETELYVANDICLGKRDSIDGILLYGTNAVGKTSLIRALGISVIMAQSGLYVPAKSFKYCPYKYIFTRILGNDNIFKGLSTFAVEMSELRTILRFANANSLILGDELCSGTESISAISIFVAGIQKLHEIKSSFIFATHLHEIVNYDEIRRLTSVALKHMTVQYDRENDILIYDRKLKDGSGDNMYGLEVCKALSLPYDFLESAHQIRMKYYPENSSILSLKTTPYNAHKIKGMCEKCKIEMGTEIHHLQHQQNADDEGIIKTDSLLFHKNHLANLLTLCDTCHNEFHNSKKVHKKVKTSKGVIIHEL